MPPNEPQPKPKKYEVTFKKRAIKPVAKIPQKHWDQIEEKLGNLASDPFPQDHKKLKEYDPPCYRVDTGEYRICYHVEGRIVHVVLIAPRKDVYEQIKRILK